MKFKKIKQYIFILTLLLISLGIISVFIPRSEIGQITSYHELCQKFNLEKNEDWLFDGNSIYIKRKSYFSYNIVIIGKLTESSLEKIMLEEKESLYSRSGYQFNIYGFAYKEIPDHVWGKFKIKKWNYKGSDSYYCSFLDKNGRILELPLTRRGHIKSIYFELYIAEPYRQFVLQLKLR